MKTVLFLLNGYGFEKKNSYSIDDDGKVMENLNKLYSEYLSGSIVSNVSTYADAYRNMSLGVTEMYNYSIVDEAIKNETFLTKDGVINLKNTLDERNSKLHIFCLVDKSIKIVENLQALLKFINPDNKRKIYLYPVLTSTNISDYDEIINTVSKINIELSEFATIAMVLGLANISNDNPINELNFFFRTLISESGERWSSFKQKLEVSKGMKQLPVMVKPFVVNEGFAIGNNDIVTIWNYDKINLSNFISTMKQINYGEGKSNTIAFNSLFKINYKEDIPYLFDYSKAKNSLAVMADTYNFSTLVMCPKKQVPIINYYLNGLESVDNPKITYVDFDNYMFNPTELLNLINTTDKNLIILNYYIDGADNIENLTKLAHNVDIMLGNVYNNSKNNPYTIIVSSLYGMIKTLENAKGEICTIDYSEKVPIIYVNGMVPKKGKYIIEPDGTTDGLLNVCYMSLSENYKGHSIVTMPNLLYRLFFK